MAPKSSKPWSQRIFVRVPRQEIAYVRFILEAYDNLAYLSVADKYVAVLRIVFSPCERQTVEQVLAGLEADGVLTRLRL